MNMRLKPRSRGALTLSLSVLALAACSTEPSTDGTAATVDATAPAAEHSGVLQTRQGAYHFTPTTCIFHKEDGVDDIEIEGPGTAPDGEKFYFELSSTGNEVVISLGADSSYQSSDRGLVAGRHVTEAFALNVSGQSLSVPKLVLADRNGQKVDNNASLQIECKQ